MDKNYAKVYILDAPYCIDRAYDYFLPPDLRDFVNVGNFVTVPFGNGNKRYMALVSEICEKADYSNVKPIISVCPPEVALDSEMLKLCKFMKDTTLCTYGDAVHTMLPSAAMSRFEEFFSLTAKSLPDNPKGLDTQALFIYEYLKGRKKASLSNIKAKFGASAAQKLKKLKDGGFIAQELEVKTSEAGIETLSYSVSATEDLARSELFSKSDPNVPKAPKCWAVFSTLLENGEMSEDDLLKATKATKVQLKSLIAKGLIKAKKSISYRIPYEVPEKSEKREITLNDEQQNAYEALCEMVALKKPSAALLYGVTGSGKTSVMLKTIDYALSQNRGVIILVPEIALTPQTLGIFCSRYGDRVAVIHSGLSHGERADTHKLIKDGRADVVIGTRSAVFAPVKNLGMIIIDEEQEHTYKSDQNPKYHARDVARFRCAENGAVMLLASATPSVESYLKAKDGKYKLLRLTKRYGNATLPQVIVSDMRHETRTGNVTPLGETLARALIDNQNEKEQAILFLNRRGYNHFASCRACGNAIVCPRCSVSMTYHTKKGTYDDGTLICHWCGMRMTVPQKCPDCGSEHISFMGYGTQRVEHEISELLPGSKILRMDTDTTATKSSYNELLGKFRKHEADLLIGTQMVTKGHDFPEVTLVGVLSADSSLYLDDYRAGERTFAMLTQVIGRAGRADKPGFAVIQTINPDNDIIKLACAQDYDSFFEREIALRKVLEFPPYCDIALLTIVSSNETELAMAAKRVYDEFRILATKDYPDLPFVVFGPFEAPVYKVDEKYRMRLVIKCKLSVKCRELFSRILTKYGIEAKSKTTLSIDFNPTNL